MSTKVTINRLATGVPGLDEVLGGGLPEFSFNLIAGPPGCGKTTLAHQMMFALATPERPALFFTVLGEPPLKMLRYQQQFDFFRQRSDQPVDPLHQPGRRYPGRGSGRGAAAHRQRSRSAFAGAGVCRFVPLRSAGQPDPGQSQQQPSAVRSATGHADDDVASDDVPHR